MSCRSRIGVVSGGGQDASTVTTTRSCVRYMRMAFATRKVGDVIALPVYCTAAARMIDLQPTASENIPEVVSIFFGASVHSLQIKY